MEAAKGLKKPAKMGLGRGLSALVSTAAAVPVAPAPTIISAPRAEPANTNDVLEGGAGQGVTFVPLSQVAPNPSQPRT